MSLSEAQWIAMPAAERGDSSPLLRRVFGVTQLSDRAELLICGLGYFEAYLNGQRVGDHVLDPAQSDYEQRCFYVRHDRIMAQVARLLGAEDEALAYEADLPVIRRALHERFYHTQAGSFGSQTADAMALQLGLVPPGQIDRVVAGLVQDIRVTHQTHTSVGIMGLRTLFEALTRHGQGELALELMHQNSDPSFGDLILNHDATTLWEYWGEAEVDQADGPRSLNHPMMAGYDMWLYNTLAGVRPDPARPGFEHFFLEPHPIAGLDWVRAFHDCPHGRIRSDWHIEKGIFRGRFTVPPGCTATLTLPWSRRIVELPAGQDIEQDDHRDRF